MSKCSFGNLRIIKNSGSRCISNNVDNKRSSVQTFRSNSCSLTKLNGCRTLLGNTSFSTFATNFNEKHVKNFRHTSKQEPINISLLGKRDVRTYCTKQDNSTLSNKEKLKRAVKDYGSTVIIFHVTISLMSLGGCYMLVYCGDVSQLLAYFGISGKIASEASTFVVAYAIHKVFAPVRIGITLTATPVIVRYLRSIGILKHR